MNTQDTEISPAAKNGLAPAAKVLGIIGLTCSVIIIGAPFAIIGLVLAIVALAKSKRSGSGRPMAITAVVTSTIAIAISVLAAVFVAWYADNTQPCYHPNSFRQYRQCVHHQLTDH